MEISFELSALANANRYSNWIYSSVAPYLGNRILELGSGIGNLSQWLPKRELLILTEADDYLFGQLQEKFKSQSDPKTIFKKIDLSHDLQSQVSDYQVDTIVSFNVMEHIEDDVSALRDQVKTLKQSSAKGKKRLVIFAPAHAFAYGSFDKIFHHFRRYSASGLRRTLLEIDPSLKVQTFYFNLLSLPGWIWFGRVKKSTTFSPGQIAILEKIIPFWRPLDYFFHRVLRLPLGQSVVAVAEIQDEATKS